MNVLSLFSGVGGMDLGLEKAGHTIIGMCEIDRNARSVLQHHWPDTPIYEDVTTLDGKQFLGTTNIVAGGSPCQNLSVAGHREGLGGTASSLFWHQCRIADQAQAEWVIWENVAGALNSNNGMDFSAVLWGLTGFAPAVPKNGWRKMGMCVGPKRTAIWRLLDAQWFGVPQRRRRIFIVAGPANKCRPEILFDCESVHRDPQKSQQQKQTTSTSPSSSFGSNSQKIDIVNEPYVKSARARSSDGYETWVEGIVNPTLNVFDMGDTRSTTVIASFDSTWSGGYPMLDGKLSPPVKVGSTLGIASPPAIATDLTVRRLTPIECERLMGWPESLYSASFEVCTDPAKNLVIAENLSLRSPRPASNVEKTVNGESALYAANYLKSKNQKQTNLAALSVVMCCEGGHTAIALPSDNWSRTVSSAEMSSAYANLGSTVGSAAFHVSTLQTLVQAIQDGRAELPLDMTLSTHPLLGLASKVWSGNEITERVVVAALNAAGETKHTKSTTSAVGQNFPNSDWRSATLLSCVIRAISSFIPEKTWINNSFSIALTFRSGWTSIGVDGHVSDSKRYKMCGNGVVSPITKWIGERLPKQST